MQKITNSEEPLPEWINGKEISCSPHASIAHNTVIVNLATMLGNALQHKSGDRLFIHGLYVDLDEENHFLPDVMIVCNRSIIHHDGIYGAPDLVVEVTSPSTARRDRTVKFQAYEKAVCQGILAGQSHRQGDYGIPSPVGKIRVR